MKRIMFLITIVVLVSVFALPAVVGAQSGDGEAEVKAVQEGEGEVEPKKDGEGDAVAVPGTGGEGEGEPEAGGEGEIEPGQGGEGEGEPKAGGEGEIESVQLIARRALQALLVRQHGRESTSSLPSQQIRGVFKTLPGANRKYLPRGRQPGH